MKRVPRISIEGLQTFFPRIGYGNSALDTKALGRGEDQETDINPRRASTECESAIALGQIRR